MESSTPFQNTRSEISNRQYSTKPKEGWQRIMFWRNSFKLLSTLRIHLCGDRGIIDFIPQDMVTLFCRGRGRRDWLSERPFERETNGGSGRGFFHGNGRCTAREVHWTTSESEQRDRQEEDWSILASKEGRDNSPVRQGSQMTPLLCPLR